MAGKTNFLTISALMFLQSGLLLLLILQLQGIVIVYKLAEMKRNLLLSSYFAAKKKQPETKKKTFSSTSYKSKSKKCLGYKWQNRSMVAEHAWMGYP